MLTNFFHNEGFFMNTFRMISRVLVVMFIVFVGGVNASDKSSKLKDVGNGIFVRVDDNVTNMVVNNLFRTGATVLSRKCIEKDQRFLQSTIRGLGNVIDQMRARRRDNKNSKLEDQLSLLDPWFLAKELTIGIGGDYGITRAGEYVHERGFTVKNVANKCHDSLTDRCYINYIVKKFVKAVGDGVTEPQALIAIARYFMPAMPNIPFGGSSVVD